MSEAINRLMGLEAVLQTCVCTQDEEEGAEEGDTPMTRWPMCP